MHQGLLLTLSLAVGSSFVSALIADDCTNLRLQNNWLIGNCLTGTGTQWIQSSVYIGNKLTNREGSLLWQFNGAFSYSCIECRIDGQAVLSCKCKPTWGQHVPTSVDLNDHIANYNGHLLSDLTGPPVVPATSSALSFPTDPGWSLNFGDTGCYTTDTVNPACPVPNIGSGATCSNSPQMSTSDGVVLCWSMRWPTHAPLWQSWGRIKINVPSGAYKFQFYDNLQCTGTPVEITSNFASCQNLGKQIVAVNAIPLWNAHYT